MGQFVVSCPKFYLLQGLQICQRLRSLYSDKAALFTRKISALRAVLVTSLDTANPDLALIAKADLAPVCHTAVAM